VALRIALLMNGAAKADRPERVPRLRNVIRIPLSAAGLPGV